MMGREKEKNRNSLAAKATGQELIITRIFDAPRELVFKLWTDPQHMAQWWGPNDFTTPVCELDVRPGGAMRVHMRGPDGMIYPSTGIYHEVIPPERLVFATRVFEDEAGNPQLEAMHTITFTEVGSKTQLTLRSSVVRSTPEAAPLLEGMEQGWTESLDKLADMLQQIKEENTMTDSYTETHPQPSATLKSLDRLVGMWKVGGETQGQVVYEWMEGGFFLIQHVDLEKDGHHNKGMEIIGHERLFGATEPSEDIKSRFYATTGETLDYVYELEGDTLTIWGGEKGSPAYYRGRFSADGDTLTGAWVWPGGGYEARMTRVKKHTI